MTETTRQYVIAGGIGVGAIVLLMMVSRHKPTGQVTTPAAPAPSSVSPFASPVYPIASFAPAPITIIEAPTFNAPGARPPFFPNKMPENTADDTGGGCKCDDKPCNVTGGTPLTTTSLNTAMQRLRVTFQMR